MCNGTAYHDLRLKRIRKATRQDVRDFIAWQDDERMLREIVAQVPSYQDCPDGLY